MNKPIIEEIETLSRLTAKHPIKKVKRFKVYYYRNNCNSSLTFATRAEAERFARYIGKE